MPESEKLALIANIAASYLRRNSVGVDQIGSVVSSVTRAIEQAAKELSGETAEPEQAAAPAEEKPRPAVPIKRSVQRDHIVCLEDGMQARTLKRHLQSAHGMTPAQYREKWRLPKDYPMVAPAYREQRSEMAKKLGLGRQAKVPAKAETPKRRSRKASPSKARSVEA